MLFTVCDKLVNNRSRNDADRQNKFTFRIHCSHSKINDDNSHDCIRSCASLRAYLYFALAPEGYVRYGKAGPALKRQH